MRFEWDENKNAENMRKHGLNFADAWQVFRNPILVKADDREDYEKGSGNYPHDLQ
ncbi:BrnT family toxin [Desulfobacterium sp. N47]|uniref:BrnT family toxin n=1 Tax=Desulfobacterium sp. N47 TaxID=3115210 RepID=UPI003C9877EA